MKRVFTVAYCLIILGLASCKPDDEMKDITRPVISLELPDNNKIVDGGDTLYITGTITDNEELSQYKIEIHDAFDGHTHLKGGSGAGIFAWDTIVSITGKSSVLSLKVPVPLDVAAGPYDFLLRALDKSGNESEIIERELTFRNLSDTILPVISQLIYNPAKQGDTLYISTNGNVTINANVSDDQALQTMEIKVIGVSDLNIYIDEDLPLAGTNFNLNKNISFQGVPQGTYRLFLTAIDEKGNRSTETTIVVHK